MMKLKNVLYFALIGLGFQTSIAMSATTTLNCYTEQHNEHMLTVTMEDRVVDNYTKSQISSVKALEVPMGYYWTLSVDKIPLPAIFKRKYSCLTTINDPEFNFPVRGYDVVDSSSACESLESEVWQITNPGENGKLSDLDIWFNEDMSRATARYEGGSTRVYCQKN